MAAPNVTLKLQIPKIKPCDLNPNKSAAKGDCNVVIPLIPKPEIIANR